MAERHRVDKWFLDVWNGKGWTRKGPYSEETIDNEYARQVAVMPNCPCRVIGEVYDIHHLYSLEQDSARVDPE